MRADATRPGNYVGIVANSGRDLPKSRTSVRAIVFDTAVAWGTARMIRGEEHEIQAAR